MPGFRSVCVTSIAAVLACSQGGPLFAQRTAAQLDGTWIGVYQSYPYYIRMSLQMPAGGQGSAEMRLEPLVKLNSIGRPPMGVVPVTVEFDAAARTIAVTPGADAYRTLGIMVPRFMGVLDDDSQLVGGVLVGAGAEASPYFILGRSSVAEKAFLSTLIDAMTQAAGGAAPAGAFQNPVRGIRQAFGRGPGEDKIREWASRLITEHPDIDPYRTEMGRVFTMARNLFRDEYFRPYFGKPYDDLDRGDLMAISAEIRKIPPPRSNFPEERPNSAIRAVERAFMPLGGTYNWTDITLSVVAMRPMEAWRNQSLKRLQAAQGAGDVLKAVAAIEHAENTALATFWPSERKAFGEGVGAARTRVAGPVLVARVDALLASATSFDGARQIASVLETINSARPAAPARPVPGQRGMPGMPAAAPVPAAVPDDIPGLMALVPPDFRQTQTTRMHDRVTQLVEAEVARDRQSLARLGDGLAGLQAGVKWRADADAKYGPLANRAPVEALYRDAAAQRKPLIEAAEKALTARVQAAKTTREVNDIVYGHLGVPSDRSDPAGARVIQIAGQRTSQLQATEAAAAAKESEARRAAASVCAQTSADKDPDGLPGEPTERDMCQAVERVLLGAQKNLADLKEECNGITAKSNPVSAMLCLMGAAGQIGGGPQLSLRGFKKIACSSAAPAGRPGFFCDYASSLASGNAMTGPIVNRFPGEVNTARFVRSSGTWLFMPTK
jgi:hypothetical protein